MQKISELYTKLNRYLHILYLVYVIPMVLLTAFLTPPFQNPDEPNHFMRAEQVSRFELVPSFVQIHQHTYNKTRLPSLNTTVLFPNTGGFYTDKGIIKSYLFYAPLQFNKLAKVNMVKTDSAKSIRWDSGLQLYTFGNTAIYVPVVYLMPCIGIWIGKFLNIPIISTMYISRLLNSFLSICICFFALKISPRNKIPMFTVLLFPMSVALFSSVSQDCILISISFLLVAIIDKAEFSQRPEYKMSDIIAMVIILSIIDMAKPPYALFAFLFLFLGLKKNQKLAIIGIPFSITLLWLFLDHNNLSIIFAPPELHINAKLQIAHILQHPFRFLGLYLKFDMPAMLNIYRMFVGVLGWLDAPFTTTYYIVATVVLCLSFVESFGFNNGPNYKLMRTALLLTVVFTSMAVIAVQYVTWTALDSDTLGGMQGRYFLPIFPFFSLALSYAVRSEYMSTPRVILALLPFVFPIVTTISIIEVIFVRYY